MPQYRVEVCLEVGGFIIVEGEDAETAEARATAWLENWGDLPKEDMDGNKAETTNREYWSQNATLIK